MTDVLSLPNLTPDGTEYVAVYKRIAPSSVLEQRYQAGELKVTPTGDSARTLAAIATDVSNLTGRVAASTVGTVTTAATTAVVEYANGPWHLTHLTMTAFAVGTSGDNAALGIGAKFYTLPSGTIIVRRATMVGGLTAAISVTTDTPEVGIGTVIASGAVSVLSGTATFEDIIDGNASSTGGDTVAPDVAGTAFYKASDGSTRDGVLIKTSGGKSHDLFLNCAVTWADVAAAGAVTYTGVITIEWMKVS